MCSKSFTCSVSPLLLHSCSLRVGISVHRANSLYINTYTHDSVPDDTYDAYLRSAALNNLEELDFFYDRLEHPQWALIFRFSTMLRVCNIGRCNLSDVTFQGLHFPVLKQLGLVRVRISECSLHTLLVGCPALESLLIYHNFGVRCIRLNSLTFRSISVLSDENRPCGGSALLQQLVIENAPCLLRLHLLDPRDRLNVSVVTAPKLETLGFINDRCHGAELSTLVLGSTVIQGVHVDKLETEMHTVKILALDMQNLSLDMVIELMRCFPCLEKLYIKSYESYPDNYGPRPGNLWRRKHRDLIRCLDLRLKTIVLTNYRGLKSQVNFVTFFVLNAKLLESATLDMEFGNISKKFVGRTTHEASDLADPFAQFRFPRCPVPFLQNVPVSAGFLWSWMSVITI